MAEIFISYARDDRAVAERLATALGKWWSVWWDRVIPSGSKYHEVIERELAAARRVIVLWSASSITSDYVREEADEARQKLAPALIADVRPPFGFRQIQAADLITWAAGSAETSLEAFVAQLREDLGEKAATRVRATASPRKKTARRTNRKMTFMTPPEVIRLVLSRAITDDDKPAGQPFLLYESDYQRTWIVSMFRTVTCVLENLTKAASYDPVRWTEPRENVIPVRIEPHNDTTGLVHFGAKHHDWLYLLELHPDAKQLERELNDRLGVRPR